MMARDSRDPRNPPLAMGGSLGSLPTENLLQMIGNLKLSTRLLLERSDTKDFSLLTFREGELVPEIESSRYPTLKEAMERDPEIDPHDLNELVAAYPDTPLWNRLLAAGLVNRDKLKQYLVDGIRVALGLFRDLSGVHFELSPLPTERLGNLGGYSVTEICALSRRPPRVSEPAEKIPSTAKPVQTPTRQPSSTPYPTPTLEGLLQQLRELVPGTLACYLVDTKEGKTLGSSITPMLDERPDFRNITDLISEFIPEKKLKVFESYTFTETYLVGINVLKSNFGLVAISGKETSLGLMVTGLRRMGERANELLSRANR